MMRQPPDKLRVAFCRGCGRVEAPAVEPTPERCETCDQPRVITVRYQLAKRRPRKRC